MGFVSRANTREKVESSGLTKGDVGLLLLDLGTLVLREEHVRGQGALLCRAGVGKVSRVPVSRIDSPSFLTRRRRSRWICDASLCLWKVEVAYGRVRVLLARGFEVR